MLTTEYWFWFMYILYYQFLPRLLLLQLQQNTIVFEFGATKQWTLGPRCHTQTVLFQEGSFLSKLMSKSFWCRYHRHTVPYEGQASLWEGSLVFRDNISLFLINAVLYASKLGFKKKKNLPMHGCWRSLKVMQSRNYLNWFIFWNVFVVC